MAMAADGADRPRRRIVVVESFSVIDLISTAVYAKPVQILIPGLPAP